jgi:hypothetical protein
MRCSEVDMEQKNAIRQVAVPWAPSRQLPPGLVVAELHQDIWSDNLTIVWSTDYETSGWVDEKFSILIN